MIAVVLAGGYAKRLMPLTLNVPKPLLKVGGEPIIGHVLESLLDVRPKLRKVWILVNSKFQSDFVEWSRGQEVNLDIVSDGSRSEKEKPGAIGALSLIADRITDDFLVVAGDSIYEDGFQGLVSHFLETREPTVALYNSEDRELVRRGAEVRIDSNRRIVKFTEKPLKPSTTLVAAAAYAFPLSVRDNLNSYIRKGLPRDEPGRLIEWLYKERAVYSYVMRKPVWDIGTRQSYMEVRNLFKSVRR